MSSQIWLLDHPWTRHQILKYGQDENISHVRLGIKITFSEKVKLWEKHFLTFMMHIVIFPDSPVVITVVVIWFLLFGAPSRPDVSGRISASSSGVSIGQFIGWHCSSSTSASFRRKSALRWRKTFTFRINGRSRASEEKIYEIISSMKHF